MSTNEERFTTAFPLGPHTRDFKDLNPHTSQWAETIVNWLSAIVQSSSDAIIGKTLEGTITSWNLAAEHLYGFTVQEMIGKSITQLIPFEERHAFQHMMARIKRGEMIPRHETIRLHKDGRRLNVSLAISPIKTLDGLIVGAATTAHDITEHKLLLEKLRQQEAASSYLAAIVQSSPDAIIGKTLEGMITSWNLAAGRIYGFTAHEMVGTSITRLIPPEGKAMFQEMMTRVKQGETIPRHETIRLHKSGKHLHVSLTISPIKVPDGLIIGAATTAHLILK